MGPVSTVTCELSNRFAARGHEVTLVDFQSEQRRALLHPGVRVVELPAPVGTVPTKAASSSRLREIRDSLKQRAV